MTPPVDFALRQFVEEVGLFYSQVGGQRMMGRVIGWLMICEPPEQSAAQIAEGLDISAGAVSTTMRQLVTLGLVERVARPGDRVTYFRVREDMWVDATRAKAGITAFMVQLAERGLALLPDASPARRARLEEMRDFYVYIGEALPRLLDAWNERRARRVEDR